MMRWVHLLLCALIAGMPVLLRPECADAHAGIEAAAASCCGDTCRCPSSPARGGCAKPWDSACDDSGRELAILAHENLPTTSLELRHWNPIEQSSGSGAPGAQPASPDPAAFKRPDRALQLLCTLLL